MDDNQSTAIEAYEKKTGRVFIPGPVVELSIDALAFAEYQQPWKTFREFVKARCHYDSETNEWLSEYVQETLLEPDIPPIYVDILNDGIALVDGAHRVTAYFIADRPTIRAQLNKE